jgi:hypothetical protein
MCAPDSYGAVMLLLLKSFLERRIFAHVAACVALRGDNTRQVQERAQAHAKSIRVELQPTVEAQP